MKKVLLFILIIGVILGAFYFLNKKEAIAPAVVPTNTANTKNTKNTAVPADAKPVEFCFIKTGKPNSDGESDKYTLRMILTGDKVTGELNFLPVESDRKTGELKGTVGPINTTTMERIADLEWFTFVGGSDTEKVEIILGKNTASVEQQGTVILNLPSVSCSEFGY